VPLWLPGERRRSQSRWPTPKGGRREPRHGGPLRLAATVREAWWNWQRAGVRELEAARGQLDNVRRIAADVASAAKAGELARADQHQADGAVAAAEAAVAQAEGTLDGGRCCSSRRFAG
jgi:cobalt-zinc-cadmium efflux system outer membrane protein